jgi:hypothetical protein
LGFSTSISRAPDTEVLQDSSHHSAEVSRVPRSRLKCDINVKEVDGVLKTGPWVITPAETRAGSVASSVCAPNRRSAGRQIGGEGWGGENEWKKGDLQEEARELASRNKGVFLTHTVRAGVKQKKTRCPRLEAGAQLVAGR